MILLGQLAYVSDLDDTKWLWAKVCWDKVTNIKREPNLKVVNLNFQISRNKI
jgi:hypothetical protein